jgi:hypothetical protein
MCNGNVLAPPLGLCRGGDLCELYSALSQDGKLVVEGITNFLLTNYSFGKSVRTSTLCMMQVIFPAIVYSDIICLYLNSSGSEVYIH